MITGLCSPIVVLSSRVGCNKCPNQTCATSNSLAGTFQSCWSPLLNIVAGEPTALIIADGCVVVCDEPDLLQKTMGVGDTPNEWRFEITVPARTLERLMKFANKGD